MKKALFFAAAFLLSPWIRGADDGGFHSITEYQAVGDYPPDIKNVDGLFDAKDMVKRLKNEKRMRLFRAQPGNEGLMFVYMELGEQAALGTRLGKEIPTVEIAENAFRPVLQHAADFANYGDSTLCGFEAGVALLLGEHDEPDFVMICCFKCHDMRIIRRPTSTHPMLWEIKVGMSPELEKAIFALTRASYPKDAALQAFKLAHRERSKTPLVKDFSNPFQPKESKIKAP